MTRYKYNLYTIGKSIELIETDYIIEEDLSKFKEIDIYRIYSKDAKFKKKGATSPKHKGTLLKHYIAARQVGENEWRLEPKGNDFEQYCFKLEENTENKLRLCKFEEVKNTKKDFVKTIIADETEYPEDGAKGDYWYVRGDKINGFNIVFRDNKGTKSYVKNAYYKNENGEIVKVKNVYYIDEERNIKNLLI